MNHFATLRNLLTLRERHSPAVAFANAYPMPVRSYTEGWHAETAARDVWRLKMLHEFGIANVERRSWLDERINERAALAARIASCAENGVVSIHESGMDCDCVTFSGILRHAVPATLYAVNKEMCDAQQWADGPLHLTVISPSEAKGVEYKTRDNVMEAYEDGHPHSVVARSPE
jgi:hypothetical protein